MNELTIKIEQAFHENKFTESFNLLKDFFELEPKINNQENEILQKVIRQQAEFSFEIALSFLILSLKSKIYNLNFLKETLDKSHDDEFVRIYKTAKEIFLETGQIENIEKNFSRLKKNLMKFKSYTPLLKEINELEEIGITGLLTQDEIVKINMGLGNIEFFEELFADALATKGEKLKGLFLDLSGDVWRKQAFAMKNKVINNTDLVSVDSAKEYLKGIYELLIVDSETEGTLKYLLIYCYKYKNKVLSGEVAKFLEKKYGWKDENFLNKYNVLKHEERESFEEIDLGEDLFSNDNEGKDVTIRRIVNQINILRGENDFNGATKLLEQLKEIDKDHTLVKELEEKKHVETGSKRKEYKKTISEIESDLLKEIGLFTSTAAEDVEDVDHLSRVAKKYVELGTDEALFSQADSLIYTFNSLGFYKSSLDLIERVFELGELRDQIGLKYLECETLRMKQDYYKSLNKIEDYLEVTPLTENEKVSFLYLKAEILRELGRKRDALKVYSKVYGLNKNYRMISDRLKEIE
jgi:hypothetical protein